MKRAAPVLLSAALFAASLTGAAADPASDRDMAGRYLQAAQSGDDDAQFYTGALYSAGVGLPASDEDAFRWFSRAAEQGHSHAMLILAGLYAIGRGVQQDYIKAYKWAYIVALASRLDEFRNGARQLLGVLETKMTPEQISLAKADASSWHAASNPNRVQPTPPATNPVAPSVTPPPSPVAEPPQATPNIAVAPSPTPKTSNDQEPRLSKGQKKDDIDNLLDQVPHGLRKRFGF
jgi:hypothetical protein